jgi:ParB family chromosome partitioning protein
VAERQRAMGRGLAAILAVAPREDGEELRVVPVDMIDPNPHQPRTRFDEEGLVALAESIRSRGVLQPVLVRPQPDGRHQLIAGERRWRAAQLAGLDSVPAIVRRDDDAASLEVALIENMAREDLDPIEEARACAALTEELGLTREEVGRRVGRSRAAVSNLVRLLDLPDEVLDAISDGRLSEGHGRALLLADDHADRRRLARASMEAGWSVRELERRARGASPESPAGPRPGRASRRPRLHPDQEAAVRDLTERLEAALGRPVEVMVDGDGFRATLRLGSVSDAHGLLERLGSDTSPLAAT